MAYKASSLLLARVFLISILLAIAAQAVAARDIPRNSGDDDQMKQPEWLFEHDRSVLIPGIGRVMLPPAFKPDNPYTGSSGSSGGSSGSSSTGAVGHIPGGDDTFVPNPGFEVPIPGNGAGTVTHP